MAAEHHVSSIPVGSDQPLIGIILHERGRDVVRYFTTENEADAALPRTAAQDALSVIGAWRDLDWEEAVEALDRIRRQTPPTPPLDL